MPPRPEPLSLLPSALVLRGICESGGIPPADVLERAGFTPAQVERYVGRCRAATAGTQTRPEAVSRGAAV